MINTPSIRRTSIQKKLNDLSDFGALAQSSFLLKPSSLAWTVLALALLPSLSMANPSGDQDNTWNRRRRQ